MVHLTTALDAASGVPLYEQLYRSLAAEMRTGGDLGGDPDARQAAAGGRAFRLGEHGGRGLSDAGGGGLSGGAGAQRLYVQEYLALPERDRVRRAAPARGSASAGAARPLRPSPPGA